MDIPLLNLIQFQLILFIFFTLPNKAQCLVLDYLFNAIWGNSVKNPFGSSGGHNILYTPKEGGMDLTVSNFF